MKESLSSQYFNKAANKIYKNDNDCFEGIRTNKTVPNKIVNKHIVFIDSRINSKKIDPLK